MAYAPSLSEGDLEQLLELWPSTVERPTPTWFRQASVAAVFQLGRDLERRDYDRRLAEKLIAYREANPPKHGRKRGRGRKRRTADQFADSVLGDVAKREERESDTGADEPLDFG